MESEAQQHDMKHSVTSSKDQTVQNISDKPLYSISSICIVQL